MKKLFFFFALGLFVAQGMFAAELVDELILGATKSGQDSAYTIYLNKPLKNQQLFAASTGSTKVQQVHALTYQNRDHWACGVVDGKIVLWKNGTAYRQWTPASTSPRITIAQMMFFGRGDVMVFATLSNASNSINQAVLCKSTSSTPVTLCSGRAIATVEDSRSGNVFATVQTTSRTGQKMTKIFCNEVLIDSCKWNTSDFWCNDLAYDEDYDVLCLAGEIGPQGDLRGAGGLYFYGNSFRSDDVTPSYPSKADPDEDDDDDACFQAVCIDEANYYWYAGYNGTSTSSNTLCVWKANGAGVQAFPLEASTAWNRVIDMEYIYSEHALYILVNSGTQYRVWKFNTQTHQYSIAYTAPTGVTLHSMTLCSYTDFGLTIDGGQVTSGNAADIFGDGKLEYVPSAKKLLVKGNTTIDHLATTSNLTIEFADPSYTLTVRNRTSRSYAVSAGNLSITGGYMNISAGVTCLYANNMTITNADITLTGGGVGLQLQMGNLTVTNSHILFTDLAMGTYDIQSVSLTNCYASGEVFFDPAKHYYFYKRDREVACDFEILKGNKYYVEFKGTPFSSTVTTMTAGGGQLTYNESKQLLTMNNVEATMDYFSGIWCEDAVDSILLVGNNIFHNDEYDGMYILENNIKFVGDTLQILSDEEAYSIGLEGGDDGDYVNITFANAYTKLSSVIEEQSANGVITFAGDYFEAQDIWDFEDVIFDGTEIVEPAGGYYDKTKQRILDADGNVVSKLVIKKKASALSTEDALQAPHKVLENNHVVIYKNGERYSVLGVKL